jgi:hypothetical protein
MIMIINTGYYLLFAMLFMQLRGSFSCQYHTLHAVSGLVKIYYRFLENCRYSMHAIQFIDS